MKSNMHCPSKSWNTYGQNEPEDNHGNAKVQPMADGHNLPNCKTLLFTPGPPADAQ